MLRQIIQRGDTKLKKRVRHSQSKSHCAITQSIKQLIFFYLINIFLKENCIIRTKTEKNIKELTVNFMISKIFL